MTRSLASRALDLVAVTAMLVAAIVGFGPVFGGYAYLVAGLGGALLGLVIAIVSARLRWGLALTALVVLVAYLVFGSALVLRSEAIAGVIPTLSSLRDLLFGIVFSWKQLLTITAPVAGFDALLIVPYLASMVAAVLGASIALRVRRFGWTLVPLAMLFVAAILFGTFQPAFPLVQGIVFAAVALGWVAWRRTSAKASAARDMATSEVDEDAASAHQLRGRRFAAGLGIVVVAGVIGGVASVPLAPTGGRDVLRDSIVPPLDLHSYASPLTSFRKYVTAGKKSTLFTVAGLPKGARVRLATLDEYDGIVYNVAGDGSGGSGTFTKVGTSIANSSTGTDAAVTVTVDDLAGVWLPDVGALSSVKFTSARQNLLANSLHYNAATGAAVATVGLQKGDSYVADVVVPTIPSRERLADIPIAKLTMPAATGIPAEVAAASSKATSDANSAFAQLTALESTLSAGSFSDGLPDQAPSMSGHGSARIGRFLDANPVTGDDEQYAVAMALEAIQLGIPARVVMGFRAPDSADYSKPIAMTGDDVHAWVEVPFEGVGWVPFDPTPPETQQKTTPQQQSVSQPKHQVLQPPPPPQAPAEAPPEAQTKEDVKDVKKADLSGLYLALGVSGGVLGLLIILIGPALLIGLLKLRRRKRRSSATDPVQRLSGGWDEVVDRAIDLGTRPTPGATRRETALVLDDGHPQVGVLELAGRADTGVFGPGAPTDAEIAAFWADVDRISRGMSASVGRWGRLRARISLRSLLTGWTARVRALATRRKETP